jgi:hypothetical protein
LQAVLPFLAFDVVVVITKLVVQLLEPGFVRIPFAFLVELFVFVERDPPGVGGVIRIGGENVEGKSGPAAVGGRTHPEAFETVAGVHDLLKPDLVAHEHALAVQAITLARLGGWGELVVPAARVVGVPSLQLV